MIQQGRRVLRENARDEPEKEQFATCKRANPPRGKVLYHLNIRRGKSTADPE